MRLLRSITEILVYGITLAMVACDLMSTAYSAVRTLVADRFIIPTWSMALTLVSGDRVVVNKLLMVPNRIYPLYRQMKHYENMGDMARTRSKAAEIDAFKVKAESPVTRDMKKEAREIQRKEVTIAR